MGLNESFLTGSRIADGVREVRPEGNALRGGSLVLAFPRITERHGGRCLQSKAPQLPTGRSSVIALPLPRPAGWDQG